MPQSPGRPRQRRRLSLSVRLSLLILFAALVPLAAVVGFTNYEARDKLITQSQRSLSTDAVGKNELVYSYFRERTLDGIALSTLPTAQYFLACRQQNALAQQLPSALTPYMPVLTGVMRCDDPVYNKASSVRALHVLVQKNTNYTVSSMYDTSLNRLISTAADMPALPPEDQSALKQGNSYISDVHYDPQHNSAYLYVYTPIKVSMQDLAGAVQLAALGGHLPLSAAAAAQLAKNIQSVPDPLVGFLQATLKLDQVWQIVAGEQGANGAGSYAFIVDQNGVRVADPNVNERFTSVAPLNPELQHALSTETRYGTSNPVPVDNLPLVASALTSPAGPATFQSIAVPGSKTLYQFVHVQLNDAALPGQQISLKWTYFVLSPLPTVTQVADDQVRTSLEAAALVAILAVLLGLLLGRAVASPVQASVADLRGATEALNTLASRQRNSASEQLWVVDACKTGLESVRYLSDAMHQAASRIVDAGNWFNQYWDRLTEDQAQRTVQHLRELAQYIEEAARRQWASSERLDKAITVTTQVSDQLAHGASAAAESAQQLDVVVEQLQRVVGGRQHAGASDEDAGFDEAQMPSAGAGGRMGVYEAPNGRPMVPGPAHQRQLPPGQRPLPAGQMSPAQANRAPQTPGAWQFGGGYDQAPDPGYPPSYGQGAWPDAPAPTYGSRGWDDR